MRIAVVGAGYVGLVSAACFAELGHAVVCVDKDAERIAALRAGRIPIHEPGLDALVAGNDAAGRLDFTCELETAVGAADLVVLAVGTPPREDGRADLSAIYTAVRAIAAVATSPLVLVVKSTVPVGTGDEIERVAREVRPDLAVAAVSNPEFLREGAAIRDFMEPDRIVVGVEAPWAATRMEALYRSFADRNVPILTTRRRTAELIKYAANSFLAAKVAFINEIADLCERVGADVGEVARGIGLDPRIGGRFLAAGPGFGGSCFPKDALALINTANDHGVTLPIIERVVHANELRKRNIGRKVVQALGGSVRGATVAVLGLTFKPDTDDMRESPAIDIVRALQYWGAQVRATDPAGIEQARLLFGDVTYAADPYGCAEGADAAVLVTEWSHYRDLDLARLKRLMRRPVLVDLRNLYDPAAVRAHGFVYDSVGR